MKFLLMFGALFGISWVMSTPEHRAAARERFSRYNRPIWIAVLAVWAVIILLSVGRH